MTHPAPTVLSAAETALALPYPALARQIEAVLRDPAVVVPARIVQPLPGGGSLFVMPATDARVAITKLITFTPGNASRGLPWHYVLLAENVLLEWQAKGARLAELLDYARLRPLADSSAQGKLL